MSTELKIVFTGPMGAGKTTAIAAISDRPSLSTEVPMSEGARGDKRHTTVGLDYGECALGDGLTLKLFGTPGQERFRLMWDVLGQNAFGLVVLVDDSQPDPLQDAENYLRAFADHVPAQRMVVGVGRMAGPVGRRLDAYCARLRTAGFDVPVLDVDVRRADDVRLLLSALVGMAEVAHG